MQVIRGNEIEFEAASHEDPKNPGVLKRVLARKTDLIRGQVQMLNWSRLPQGSSFQSHYHEDMLEVFVMLGGPVAMEVDNNTVELKEGDAILIHPREVHKMENLSEGSVDYLVFGISTEEGGQTVIVE
jgi:quercetin dioxygenase-like cupin family protein